MKKNDTRLQLRLSLKEKEKIERNAKRCGITALLPMPEQQRLSGLILRLQEAV